MSLFKLPPPSSSRQGLSSKLALDRVSGIFPLACPKDNACSSTTCCVAQAGAAGTVSPQILARHPWHHRFPGGTKPSVLAVLPTNLAATAGESSENTDSRSSCRLFYCTVRCQMRIFLNSTSAALFFQF